MSLSRHALALCCGFSLPLLFWLLPQLALIEWDAATLTGLFRPLPAILVLLQTAVFALLLFHRPAPGWPDEIGAALHVVLFPLPILAIVWLSGSAAIAELITTAAIPGALAIVAVAIRRSVERLASSLVADDGLRSIPPLLLAILLWNFSDAYRGLLSP